MEFKTSKDLIAYEDALGFMDARVAGIRAGEAEECVWLLEHPSLYTAGTSAKDVDLLDDRFPVFKSGRGGELKARQGVPDIKKYVWQLEEVIIRTLAAFDVTGERRCGRVGIWVVMPDGSESKIAAIGVRVRHWITLHGIAINVDPDLSHFGGIVPCGISEHGVTSLKALGVDASMDEVDAVLQREFDVVFTNNIKLER